MKNLFTISAIALALTTCGIASTATNSDNTAQSVSQSQYTSDTPIIDGSIGKYPIKMKLTFNTSTRSVSGWYYYSSKGAKSKIQLSGSMNGDPVGNVVTLTLKEKVNGKVTGTFSGDFSISFGGYCEYIGTWTSPAGKRLSFNLSN